MKLSTIFSVSLRTLEVHFRKLFKRPPRPYKLLLELTYSCNSRCETCSIWKTPHVKSAETVSLRHIETLLNDYGANLLWLSLSGGEITLYEELDGLVYLIQKHCKSLKLITFTTNGLLPEKALFLAQRLKALDIDIFVTISLDGDEATHDSIRGIPGNYQLAQETLALLKNQSIPAHFGITLGSHNSDFVKNNWAQYSKNIKAVTFIHSGGIYQKINNVPNAPILNSLRTIIKHYLIRSPGEWIEKVYLRIGVQFLEQDRHKNIIPCEVLNTSLHITPDGSIHPCMFLPAMGNIKSTSVNALLQSDQVTKISKQISDDNCPHCWMNCYAPHSIMQHPFRSVLAPHLRPFLSLSKKSISYIVRRWVKI